MKLDKLVGLKLALLDKLMGCRTVERSRLFVQEGELWRENEYHCERCGKFFFKSERPVNHHEFWEDDNYYLLPLADTVTER